MKQDETTNDTNKMTLIFINENFWDKIAWYDLLHVIQLEKVQE